ncbi:MAG: hypothetical protein GY769_00785 [bacterium]|nr:hypothetical protein [bacterium]
MRRAYSRAAFTMHDVHAFRKIGREFDRLSDAMYDLEMNAEDLLGRVRPAHRRYRDWDGDSDSDSDSDRYRPRRSRRHARIVLPRVRVSWDWLDH